MDNRMKYFLLGCILILCVALIQSCEGFGMSPGTLTQLQSTSVSPMGQYLVY